MVKDYSLPDYDKYRQWIMQARNKQGKSWEEIEYGLRGDDKGLDEFLQMQAGINFWDIDATDWKELVSRQKKAEEQSKQISLASQEAMIVDDGEDGDFYVPDHPESAWQLYRKKLIEEKHFKKSAVDEIENSTIRILKRLHKKTEPGEAVKGLVIGNVQSGKTASMAALIAMSADWGWNMFIVLSGTIENLRKQTQSRLFNDLHEKGNLRWSSLEYLSRQSPEGQRAQDLHFEEGSDERYFTVCLKNSARLRKLIQWLQSDPNKQKQMRILVIDDEADQAGINTAKISDDEDQMERKKINQLLVNLVNGKNEKGKDTPVTYQAVNYIGYTATPYANILNEAGKESLYPRSFITTLGVSDEYFGPQQIFGKSDGDFDGLDIIREINSVDLEVIRGIHDGDTAALPDSLKEAICWFIDGVACRRLWQAHKPVSMLIHTSQKTDHHRYIEEAIMSWFEKTPHEEIFGMCHEVWEDETKRFSLKKFREEYPSYDIPDDEINDYPVFDDIAPFVKELISDNPTHIGMGEDGDFEYTDGIHICVDNCKNNGVSDDGMYMRITYPTEQKDLDRTPAFIVIGGQTLSRGLTLEGLLCTYFLRSVGQADTLMQMGRWFGYRKGYELLVRVWLTEKTDKQFRFLSDLDQELRDEIYNMDITGKIPANYGPHVKNTPSYGFIRITAKNKMQSAQPTEMDYSGSFSQTYMFDDDYDTLHFNLEKTMELLQNLGKPEAENPEYRFAAGTKIWRKVDFSVIKGYLKQYRLQKNMHLAGTIDSLIQWIDEITEEGNLDKWDVVLSDKGTTGTIDTPIGEIHLATRTRKNNPEKIKEGVIDIGALRNPGDLLADVDYNRLDEETRTLIDSCTTGQMKALRNTTGMEKIPQLILYFVDKDSEARPGSQTRVDLKAPENIAGYCLNIPGGSQGVDYATKISIKIDSDVFDGEADLEESDEN